MDDMPIVKKLERKGDLGNQRVAKHRKKSSGKVLAWQHVQSQVSLLRKPSSGVDLQGWQDSSSLNK